MLLLTNHRCTADFLYPDKYLHITTSMNFYYYFLRDLSIIVKGWWPNYYKHSGYVEALEALDITNIHNTETLIYIHVN